MTTGIDTVARLREWFPKGSTVYTILRHRSASGISRTIGVVALLGDHDGSVDVRHPNYATADVLGLKEDREREGVKVQGCGMDMGFEIAYRLGEKLYGDGYALKHQWL
jgi:hypothetical protein